MKEVKTPKKPLIYYYSIVMLVVFTFNLFIMPMVARQEIKEVDYATFMKMTEEKDIGRVKLEDYQILFTDKAGENIYRTGLVDDQNLTERLYESGAIFSSTIQTPTTPLAGFITTFVIPMIIFAAIGQYMSKKMLQAMGGKNAMQFPGMGKSNARVYVESTEGIHFDDVAGEDEAKESLAEIVD